MRMVNVVRSSLILSALVALISVGVQAQNRTFLLKPAPPYDPNYQNPAAGEATYISASFNPLNKQFAFQANFKLAPSTGRLPDGFWLVLNNGPMPHGRPGTLAILFIDVRNVANPIVTVYGYNGMGSQANSWLDGSSASGVQPPDRILSSIIDSSWITRFRVQNEGNASRTLDLAFDATRIIAHTPLYTSVDPGTGQVNPWFGIGFDSFIGIWLHAFSGMSASYGSSGASNGYLTSFTYPSSGHGYYDLTNACTEKNNPPTCNLGGPYQKLSCQGELSNVLIDLSKSTDPDGQVVSYFFSTTCENGQASLTQKNSTTLVLGLIAPGLGMAQNCSVSAIVSDGLTYNSCSVPVSMGACENDCLNVPNGDAQVDACGVCNGNNACVDCAGTPYGNKVTDLCGVCGGDNACLDCHNIPNGGFVLDRCDVCGGDGTSCLGCEQLNNSAALFAMDSGALRLRNSAISAANRIKSSKSASKKDQVFADKAKVLAEQLYNQAWISTWSNATVVTSCSNSEFCTQIDNTQLVGVYNQNSSDLLSLIESLIQRLTSIKGEETKASKRLLRNAQKQHKENLEASNSIPKQVSKCD